jgi:hypothetical protein
MRVLVGFEFSGRVRDAFLARGHDAISVDLRPSETPGPHYQGDIFEFLAKTETPDLAIFHPPCTYLCNSGVRWLYEKAGRWYDMIKAANVFKSLLELPIPKVAVENPIPHKYAVQRIGRKYDQIVQPWMWGDNESKAICLWLLGLHPLVPQEGRIPAVVGHTVWREPPSPDRSKNRSRTYQGFAKAMAEQWG